MELESMKAVQDQIQVLQGEKQSVRNRIGDITQKIMTPITDNRTAWERAVEGGFVEIDTKTSLREELELLEGQERYLNEALEGGKVVLDRARGQESLKACQAARPAVVAQAKRLLLGLREVEKANRELRRLRDNIEDQGFTAGSLPVALYDLGGMWNDRRGGRLPGYCRYISENFPELSDLATSDLEAK